MKFLIDTNVFIPLEPTSPSEEESLTETALQMASLAMEAGYALYRHPAAIVDLDRDRNLERSRLRHLRIERYPLLPDPPPVTSALAAKIGSALLGSNDWVDHQLLAALSADAVDFLVTEDRGIQAKGRRGGIGSRILSVAEALDLIKDLSERAPSPPPAVRSVKAHAIQADDPILDGFREDYPDFDLWLRRCKLEHRQAWIIGGEAESLAAVCIVNPERSPPTSLHARVLKICSFKVGERWSGSRFGELLLKTVFEHAFDNGYQWIFVTIFEKHERLIDLFEAFGFTKLEDRTRLGELILAKPLRPEPNALGADPLQFHIRYGPRLFQGEAPWFLVPIQPRYSRVLFPETSDQQTLLPGAHAFGNAIRKAYLCHSPIRTITKGSVLLFYQSVTNRGAIALGIVEETLVSSSPEEVVRTVGKRTVYSMEEIQTLCRSPVLAILFRQARILGQLIPVEELVRNEVFQRVPQSISALEGRGLAWLKHRLAE